MFLKNCDFLSPNITLYYYNKKRHSSVIGGLLSLIMIILYIYLFIHYTFFKIYASDSSLLIYRNYDKKIYINFNDSNHLHNVLIFNENNFNNNVSQNLIQLNNLKRGILRIYMTYSYDNYDFNSLNLNENDHWVYDTCSNYDYNDDLKYDSSLYSCIKYYYNSEDKKYYSINDYSNFKWPYIRENIQKIDKNIAFGTFIEKCTNNSNINDILGDCYSQEIINNYLSNFNKIILSVINSKIEINNLDSHIKSYSHRIYNTLNHFENNYFYLHDLTFVPFSYKGSKSFLDKRKEFSSFMLEEDKMSRIWNTNNTKLLLAYIFHVKNYYNEFRLKDRMILEFINGIGSSFYLIYLVFYISIIFISERIETRNFHLFLNNKGDDLIHRHINYERSKLNSVNKHITKHLSNDVLFKQDGYNTFKSIYGLKNEMAFNNYNSNENNNMNTIPKMSQDNNYTIKINKIDEEESQQKKDNIIVINNNSFLNNNNNNKYIRYNSPKGKYDSLKLLSRYVNFEKTKDSQNSVNKFDDSKSFAKAKNIIRNNHLDFVKVKPIKIESPKSKRINSNDQNSKQKIIDTSCISLLNENQNKSHNNYISNSSHNDPGKIDTPLSQKENADNFEFFSKLNTKFQESNKKYYQRGKNSSKRLGLNYNLDFMNSPSKRNEKNKNEKINKSTNIMINNKERRQSHQAITIFKYKKDKDDHLKGNKSKHRKAGEFFKLQENKEEKNIPVFQKNSYGNLRNFVNEVYQTPVIRNPVLHKHGSPIHNIESKNNNNKKQSFELELKSMKKSGENSVKKINQQNRKLVSIFQNYELTPKNIFNYICLCKEDENNIYVLNKFKNKLLSEEYLYILHINMFIFKEKFGCKSNLQQELLLEELYNDYLF